VGPRAGLVRKISPPPGFDPRTVGADGPGRGEIFRICPDRLWGAPSLLYNEYRVFPGGKERPGRDADPSPSSSAMVMKEQSYISTPPTGPYGLYRASVPVQGCTLTFFCIQHAKT